ncbi:MAG: DNA alkylation repair protein [Robiginitomaculum sp.]|nr:MAG: DNA alkylation repair protein [Robiginitomaculum sp.]
MAEPFKNAFNVKMIAAMGGHLSRVDDGFDEELFVKLASEGLEALELKQRSTHIYEALVLTLPSDYPRAIEVLLASLHVYDESGVSNADTVENGIKGWGMMAITEYVAKCGLENDGVYFDLSLDALAEMTSRFSSEFDVRPFLLADTDRAMAHFTRWVHHANHHVRRLASEGSRPKLPWASQLPMFIADPMPVLPLLEALKDDSEEYVRRSVANHLNDIAKDHPDLVADIAQKWLKGASTDRTRLVRHACRTLIKQGHKGALTAFGYGAPEIELSEFYIPDPEVQFGGALDFSVRIGSACNTEQNLMIDYILHHRKANGKTTPKVFKWKSVKLAAGQSLVLSKSHPMKPISTRKYYQGLHHLELQINGQVFGKIDFQLMM